MAGRHREQQPPSWLPVVAVLVGVALSVGVGLVLLLLGGDDEGADDVAVPSVSSTGTVTAGPDATPAEPTEVPDPVPATPTVIPPPPPPPPSSEVPDLAPGQGQDPGEGAGAPLVLRVEGGESYVRVTLPDGGVVEDEVLPDGTTRTYDQPELDVRIGNAGAVVVSVYGEPERRAGAPDEVVDLEVRPEP